MHDLNSARVDDLLNTISEAKRSLNTWQDKQTEALIRLDAFTYDIQQLEADKKRTNATNQELKQEIENREKIFKSQVNELTDQMQVLKLENEMLRNETLEKKFSAETSQKELEAEKRLREQLVQQHLEKEREIKLDVEVRLSNQVLEQKSQMEALHNQNVELSRQKEALDLRADRLEYELSQLRSRLMNVLDVNEVEAREVRRPVSLLKREKIPELTIQEVKKLRPMETEPATVEEYLKRLGY